VPYNLGIVVQPYAIPICIMGNHGGVSLSPTGSLLLPYSEGTINDLNYLSG